MTNAYPTPALSAEQRSIIRKAITASSQWPAFKALAGIADSSGLSTSRCIEAVTSMDDATLRAAVDALDAAGEAVKARELQDFVWQERSAGRTVDLGSSSSAPAADAPTVGKVKDISPDLIDALEQRFKDVQDYITNKRIKFFLAILKTIREKQHGWATQKQAQTMLDIIDEGWDKMKAAAVQAGDTLLDQPAAAPAASSSSSIDTDLKSSTALPAIPSLTAIDPGLIAKLDAVAVAFGADPAASKLQEAAAAAVTAAGAYKAAYEAALQAPSLGVGVSISKAGYIPPAWAKQLRTLIKLGRTVALVGPMGNGKTTAARAELEAMGYTVFEVDCDEDKQPSDLIGRRTISAEDGVSVAGYELGPVAKAMQHPKGALILNEYDALSPQVGMAFQSFFEAPSEGQKRRITLPENGEQLQAVADCPVVLTMNTLGNGATRQYVGRNSLDGANRDRIEIISTGYEAEAERLEAHGYTNVTAQWLAGWADSIRLRIEQAGLRVGLSMRRLLTAAALIDKAGMSRAEAVDMAFFSRLEANEAAALR